MHPRAVEAAERLAAITEAWLARPHAVLLGILTPTTADHPGEAYKPWRSRTAAATNAILQGWLGNRLPAGRVVWVDYLPTVLATPDWERVFRLHPTRPGSENLADALAETLVGVGGVDDPGVAATGIGPRHHRSGRSWRASVRCRPVHRRPGG